MNAINTPWLILIVYWVISAFRVRKNKKTEPMASRLAISLVVIGALELLFRSRFSSATLQDSFMPYMPAVRYLGILLLWGGVAFAIWARYHIGEYWSARVAVKEDHRVIDLGPYAHIRHPIYSGILLGLIGTALAVGNWRAVVAFLVILVVLILKARAEEKLLTEQLGNAYVEYKKRTGMLIPFSKMASR
jgi:protein-S-isoprenylcysteine O-methyltransferase Ste14